MYTYLVIDDEKWSRKGTIEKLKPLAEHISCAGEASDGREGLAMIARSHPDLVITDMKMPYMNGMDLLSVIAEKYPDIFIIVISGYKNFDYTKQAIRSKAVDYIVKPFGEEEICASVRQALLSLHDREKIREKLMSGNDYIQEVNLKADQENLYHALQGYDEMPSPMRSDTLSFLNGSDSYLMLTIWCEKQISEANVRHYLMDNGLGGKAVFFRNKKAEKTGYLLLRIHGAYYTDYEKYLKAVWRRIRTAFLESAAGLHAGISNVHCGLEELATARKESVSALDDRLLDEQDELCFYQSTMWKPVAWRQEEEFLCSVEQGIPDRVRELVEELFVYFAENTWIRLGEMKLYFRELEQKSARFIRELSGFSMGAMTDRSILRILDTIFSLAELKDYYRQFFGNLAASVQKVVPESEERDLVTRIREYTEEHYAGDLSGEMLASVFHVSRTYLSHMFRQKTGETYNGYLNRVRIQKAKILLRGTDNKTYQIAMAVGYENVRHFYRTFRKLEGISPEEYRDKIKKCNGEM